MKKMGIFGNLSLTYPVLKQFVEGGILTPDEKKLLQSIQFLAWNNFVTGNKSFSDEAHQVQNISGFVSFTIGSGGGRGI